jgi:hypothetical protein
MNNENQQVSSNYSLEMLIGSITISKNKKIIETFNELIQDI